MKSKEFKTSKGEFVIVDGYDVINGGIKLSEITEDQAKEIIDSRFVFQTQYIKDMLRCYSDYLTKDWVYTDALPSLHSLIKSLGIHLYRNPLQSTKPTEDLSFYDNASDAELVYNKWQEAEQYTFYNPYIFKKI